MKKTEAIEPDVRAETIEYAESKGDPVMAIAASFAYSVTLIGTPGCSDEGRLFSFDRIGPWRWTVARGWEHMDDDLQALLDEMAWICIDAIASRAGWRFLAAEAAVDRLSISARSSILSLLEATGTVPKRWVRDLRRVFRMEQEGVE